jgi:hypothetical protein
MSIEQAIDFYIALSGFTEHPGQNEFYISFGNGRFAAFEVEENVLWAEIHRDFFGEKIYTRLEGSRADFICMEGNLHDELLRYLENEEEMRVLMKKYKGEREQKERARQERLKPLPQLLTEYSS